VAGAAEAELSEPRLPRRGARPDADRRASEAQSNAAARGGAAGARTSVADRWLVRQDPSQSLVEAKRDF